MHPLALIGFGAGCLLSAVVIHRAIKWFKSDPHKDLMFFMGPKESGKSEMIAALKREPFNPNRIGTGLVMDAPDEDTTFGYGANKFFCTMESGGEGNLIEKFSQHVADYIGRKRPEYVLLTLVVDVNKISEKTIIEIGEYLNHFNAVCESEPRWWQHVVNFDYCKYFNGTYNIGRWGFTIVGTHTGKATQKQEVTLEKLGKTMCERGYAGKLRWVKGVGLFELSDRVQRNKVICWVEKKLKLLHSAS